MQHALYACRSSGRRVYYTYTRNKGRTGRGGDEFIVHPEWFSGCSPGLHPSPFGRIQLLFPKTARNGRSRPVCVAVAHP